MNAANFPSQFGVRPNAAQQAWPMSRFASMLNKAAEGSSPLEAARQALVNAKDRLDRHRDEEIEKALDGYLSLRARQTSYEGGLAVQQEQLENFQSLVCRREQLSQELSDARADYEAYAAAEPTPDFARQNRLSARVSSLEHELASAEDGISTLVEQANRYADSQRKYADYLEKTGQGGYAAFEYRGRVEYSEANFASETAGMIGRMEAGAGQWRERVFSYCGQRGLTPYDFESYLQERRKLGDAYSAARQRFAELLYAAEQAAPEERAGQEGAGERVPAPGKADFDTVEIGGTGREEAFP